MSQSLFNYQRRPAHAVRIGQVSVGGDAPVVLQSMTTTATTDTEGSVAQCRAIVDAGGEIVRLTTQGTREAENLAAIRDELRRAGYDTPLVADVHFNPNVADVAAAIVEKVRINPGNYVDPARTFKQLEYTDEEYAAELCRLEERFGRLLDICRAHGTALRIGVNHGSLSDRIMCRYGDTPAGIVESCMEFLRVCKRQDFADVVVSVKASNTVVMVESVRLLCEAMEREGMDFPLHLGVTEAGEGEDGRIKSACGIGALLADGIGDTIRVSLSEAPECEIPVARKLAAHVAARAGHPMIPAEPCADFCYTRPQRRPTRAVLNIGGENAPVVMAAAHPYEPQPGQPLPDYLYTGAALPPEAERTEGVAYVVDAGAWRNEPGVYPAYSCQALPLMGMNPAPLKFVFATYIDVGEQLVACLRRHPEAVVIAQSNHPNRLGELRAIVHELWAAGVTNPVVAFEHYVHAASELEDLQIEASADCGALFFDRLVDGLFLHCNTPRGADPVAPATVTGLAFGILQATRRRITRTEYISCPGCGRTLYDLQGTIARIRRATAHLKGLKIGIMGCIVNGPGEMADADYGYVGAARGRVSLYRGRTCVEKNIPEAEAVDRLLALIEADGHRPA